MCASVKLYAITEINGMTKNIKNHINVGMSTKAKNIVLPFLRFDFFMIEDILSPSLYYLK
ncbi:hypothetical protein SDC9_178871 [bioreactor metagenome]|uniref:Uncharacterized protein n=1 Tax=bioreactor metagenome TaxID=1076179 RepID=A0A645GXE8_9ZZZZ